MKDALHHSPEEIVERLCAVLDPVDARRRKPRRSDFDLNREDAPAPRKLKPAAVLVPLVRREERLCVIFTRRADHLQAHAGQISFPGGRQNVGRESLAECALRETAEEIGVSPDEVELLGRFDAYATVTGYAVTPFVGLVDPGFELVPDPGEVAEVFETPFDFLMNPRNHRLEEREFRGRLRRYYAMPYQGRYIWGATAGMLKALSDRLTG
ncbi:CoA pyrophosphatase [Marinicauda algicola]|uniref:CoA pyrophosphatase n=1 Tax=Marinicauda algicola TaxID=2029849 RepID=A0A4S2GXU0_9PROT|nr:CoA pyrophosphatase [Marinicauda algicola]TGY87592.1 CoA pyrophosphatase [Marinicauda algicola]